MYIQTIHKRSDDFFCTFSDLSKIHRCVTEVSYSYSTQTSDVILNHIQSLNHVRAHHLKRKIFS